MLLAAGAGAKPVSPDDAKHAVAAWLATAPVLGGEAIQRIRPENVVSYDDADGTVLFHVVSLEEGGFVVTAADDSVPPILLYSTSGEAPDEDPGNPFWTLAAMSVRSQMAANEIAGEWTDDPKADTLGESAPVAPRDEWAALLAVDLGKLDALDNPVNEVSDVRVDRILTKGASGHIYHLTQDTAAQANAGWNYTTTYKYANISQRYGEDFASKNYASWPWGCGVVAVAKVLMYWGCPDVRPSGFSYRPPNALPGYNWRYIAGGTDRISDVALLSDVGEAMGAAYKAEGPTSAAGLVDNNAKAGSTAASATQSALKSGFGYANAEFLPQTAGIDASTFQRILGSNLDAECPVIIGVSDHDLVADGYGYIGSALYYHLDLGWGGLSTDRKCSWGYWWRLPAIPISEIGYGMGDYNAIQDLTYNIFPFDKDCQIISGRTVGPTGDGCLATVSISGPGANACTSPNGKGIFYFIVPKGSGTYTVTAQYLLESKTRTVQLNGKDLNYWGCDFSFGSGGLIPGGLIPGGTIPGGTLPGGSASTAPAYKVKFYANGGKGKMAVQKMTYGKSAKLKANKFKRKGYVFLGWAKKKSSAPVYKNKQAVKNLTATGGTVKLYAKWGRKVVIRFNPNGGTVRKKEKTAVTGKKIGSLPKPTRKNRDFKGWWTKATGGKRVTASTVVKKAMTLYARWGEEGLPNGSYSVKINGVIWKFSVSKGKATVTGVKGNPNLPKKVSIPSKLGGRPVTGIGKNAFFGAPSRLEKVTIPNSVKSIGYRAFALSGLTSVAIPNSVTSIGDQAFYCCTKLTSATIGKGVKSIGDKVFYSCGKLTSITIPDSVTSIGSDAFWGCSSLQSIRIGNNVKSIGEYSFQGCGKLSSVTIGNSMTSITPFAFSGCSELRSIQIGNSVESIGQWSFANCSKLTSITIPDSVTSIGSYAFYGSGLSSITIPAHLQSQLSSWYLPPSCRIVVR